MVKFSEKIHKRYFGTTLFQPKAYPAKTFFKPSEPKASHLPISFIKAFLLLLLKAIFFDKSNKIFAEN